MDLNIAAFLRGEKEGVHPKRHAYVHVPSLFQHEGRVRTNDLSVKYHLDNEFQEYNIVNPYLMESLMQDMNEEMPLTHGKP